MRTRIFRKRLNNKGSTTVEAALALPIFLFVMLAFYVMGQCKLAELAVYEAAIETAEYDAEFAYISSPDLLLTNLKFDEYLDDRNVVKKYVDGGLAGVSFLKTNFDDSGYIVIAESYSTIVDLPMIPKLRSKKEFSIKQKLYRGDGTGEETTFDAGEEAYVYVTDNRDVYHSTRACTHLNLSIREVDIDYAKAGGFSPCERCGGSCAQKCFITDQGRRFHTNIKCSGLKRTIYRVEKDSVSGLPGCGRCVREVY